MNWLPADACPSLGQLPAGRPADVCYGGALCAWVSINVCVWMDDWIEDGRGDLECVCGGAGG